MKWIFAGIVVPFVLATAYISVTRSTSIPWNGVSDWAAILIASIAGAFIVSFGISSIPRKIIVSTAFIGVSTGALIFYLLLYVCAVYDACL